MSYPLRPRRPSAPRQSGDEPRFAGARLQAAAAPADVERVAPLHFPGDARRAAPAEVTHPTLSASAADRLVVSSPTVVRADRSRGPGLLRQTAFMVLLALAALGAVNLYQMLAGFFPLPQFH